MLSGANVFEMNNIQNSARSELGDCREHIKKPNGTLGNAGSAV
jgi:hypothetical protein